MKFKFALLLLPVAVLVAAEADAQVAVYVSPNDIQTAEASGILGINPTQIFTESFDGLPTGSIDGYHSAVIGANYSATDGISDVHIPGIYGGHDSGDYLAVRQKSSTTLALDTPSQYFGLYFTAADKNNFVEIYNGSVLLLTFTTSQLIDLLPKTAGAEVTAINGDTYYTSDYYGQPVSNKNSAQIYAYLHFVTAGNVTFDKIVLSQKGSAVFENDNHSILTATPIIPDTLVEIIPPVPVPEPSTLMVSITALGGLLLRRKR